MPNILRNLRRIRLFDFSGVAISSRHNSAQLIVTGMRRALGNRFRNPAGSLSLTFHGGGYFGKKGSGLPEYTFFLSPEDIDLVEFRKFNRFSWAVNDSVAVASMKMVGRAGGKSGVITTIQPSVLFSRLPKGLAEKYRYSTLIAAVAAADYCRKKGIKLYAIHPDVYASEHLDGGSMSEKITSFYSLTLKNVIRLLSGKPVKGKKLPSIPSSELGREYSDYFGGKLVRLI